MSDKDLSLEDLGDLENVDLTSDEGLSLDEGMDLGPLDDLSEDVEDSFEEEELPEDEEDGLSLSDESDFLENVGDLDLPADIPSLDDDMGPDAFTSIKLLDSEALGDEDLSEDAKEKLKEIDAIMESTASKIYATPLVFEDEQEEEEKPAMPAPSQDSNINESIVSEDLNFDSLDFSADESEKEEEVVPEPPKKKKKEAPAQVVEASSQPQESFKEISGAYTMEMERTQATIANLRADREELLSKIQNLEEHKLLQNRQSLTLRAELDEKKIELTIMRRKLNEEIGELKDRMHLHDEKRLLLEERNKMLTQELDKANQKNKIDVKKVQMRERELEQRLELLKSDAETQIKHRDLKILELKRKIDAMEFDMESISQQEKKSVESRFELEDKLDKAIKTLRGAITVLENESDKNHVLDTLKKNIDM